MNYLKKFDYEYVDPAVQYTEQDFTENDIVKAEYIHVDGKENKPDIEALPKLIKGKDAIDRLLYIPEILRNPNADPLLRAISMRSMRIPLINQGLINECLYSGIIDSYEDRKYAITEKPVVLKKNDNPEDDIKINILDISYDSSRTVGSALIGLPGTGKSTALNIALDCYPKAIKHEFEGGHYIQIPIVRTTAYANSNVTALFESFATKLDIILGTGHMHRDSLKGQNVGCKAQLIIDYIRTYHIGAWCIEEIEFFRFTSDKNTSFENIVTIMQETGIFLFVTGNDDFIRKMNGNLRILRRFLARYIDMNLVSQNKAYMKSVVERMWRYMLPELSKSWKDDYYDSIYEATEGSIDLISILLVAIQQEYLVRIAKNPKNKYINKAFIESVAKKQLSKMKDLFKLGLEDAEFGMYGEKSEAYKLERKKFDQEIDRDAQVVENAKIQTEREIELGSGYDRVEKLFMIKDALEGFFSYKPKEIESAFTYCEKNIENFKSMTKANMKTAVLKRLEEMKGKKPVQKQIVTKKEQVENMASYRAELLNLKKDD